MTPGINKISDLNGKTIGVSRCALNYGLLCKSMLQLITFKFNYVQLGPSQSGCFLRSPRRDAFSW